MLSRLFPKQYDNAYQGHWLALLLFAIIVLLRVVQGADAIAITELVMKGADGIPVEHFAPEAEQTTIALFSLLGVHLLILPIICFIALIRYRAMIPFLFVVLLIQQVGGRVLLIVRPVAHTSTEAGHFYGVPIGVAFTVAVFAMTLAGLALSLRNRTLAS